MNRRRQLLRLGCFILLTLVLTGTVSFAEIRYVKANSQSAVPPYTSWSTASDSIQKCIDICSYGDTIYIAPGVYKEKLMVKPGLSIIGSGIDTTIIDTREIATPTDFYAITVREKALLSNFSVLVSFSNVGIAILFAIGQWISNVDINQIKISNAGYGIYAYNGNGSIRSCIITDCNRGLDLYNGTASIILVENNIVSTSERCISIQPSASTVTIRNNILMPTESYAIGYLGTLATLSTLTNNLIIAGENGAQTGISANASPHIIQNNMVYDKGNSIRQGAFLLRDNTVSINNYSQGALSGFWAYLDHSPIIKHNNSWNNVHNYYNFTPDSTNISADPMFVNPDSLDFRLQKFSPMIDAGDPEINDLDGSRSDIGLLGGPYGGFYEYIDLAPKIPKGFSSELLPKNILLRWNKNTEYDFSYYTIYRDTVSDSFTPDSSNLLGTIRDTLFIDNTVISSSAVYYKITAVDLAGNQSPASPAASVITGMDGETAEVNNPDYRLYPNYPNPFNPSTTITYTLEKGGLVQLVMYDIQGQLVDVLVNREQEAGVHKVIYTIKNTNVPSGILMIRIQVKDDLNRMIYSEVIKALILK